MFFHLMYHKKIIEGTRPRYTRTRPVLHEAENEAEAKTMRPRPRSRPRPSPQNLASRPYWPRGLNIPAYEGRRNFV